MNFEIVEFAGPFVQRLGHRPLTSATGVRFPYGLLVFKELGIRSDSFFWAVVTIWSRCGHVWSQDVTGLINVYMIVVGIKKGSQLQEPYYFLMQGDL